jgi:hypothetical protein
VCGPTSKEWHNFHVHQNPFQVVSINGKPVNYIDYEDTINLQPCETAKILIHPIDFTGKFVFHCHLTFHEDNGMMGVVQVLAHPTPQQINADLHFNMRSMPMRSVYAATGVRFRGATGLRLYCRHLLALENST